MNNWTGIGNLGRDNDLKFGQAGTAVLSQSLGVRRSFKDKQTGDYETDWVGLVMFGKTAENFANFTKKGSKVGIEGRIQSRNYENQQGQRVYVTEVIVSQFHLLDPKNSNNQTNNYQNNQSNNQNNYNNQSQNSYNNQSNNQPFNIQDGKSVDINPDDLPF